MPVLNATPEPFEVSLNGFLRDLLQIPVLPLRVPQSVSPQVVRIVYNALYSEYDLRLGGSSGVVECNVQFDLYGPTYDDVLVLETQLRFALQDFTGYMGGTWVYTATPIGKPGGFLIDPDSSDKGTSRRTVEYSFRYRHDVPLRESGAEE